MSSYFHVWFAWKHLHKNLEIEFISLEIWLTATIAAFQGLIPTFISNFSLIWLDFEIMIRIFNNGVQINNWSSISVFQSHTRNESCRRCAIGPKAEIDSKRIFLYTIEPLYDGHHSSNSSWTRIIIVLEMKTNGIHHFLIENSMKY
jgi:hypothetical protein